MRDGFAVCRTLGRPLAGAQPPGHRLLEQPGFGQVPGEKLRLGRNGLREIGFEHGGDMGVKLLAAAAQEAAIGGVADQRVFEQIARMRRAAAGEDEAGLGEPE